MRLADAPIIGGESKELRAVHPQARNGPVLILPAGWEPCWTMREILPTSKAPTPTPSPTPHPADAEADGVRLARELHDRGWIVFSAKGDRGDWDLYEMRPDGSDRRQLTDTPDFNEAGARYSRDGQRLLYYRIPQAEGVDNNTYGTFELVLADADGGHAEVWGRDYPWASWGPDGTQLACLLPQGIRMHDVATRAQIRQLPRRGIVSQLVWSPDGQALLGTANGLGPYWNIGQLDVNTGEIQCVSEGDRYNCTGDWYPDSQQIVYARGIVPQAGGLAQLWTAAKDGTNRRLLYAEQGFHIYGSCPSPDGKYVLFTRSVEDLGAVDRAQTAMSVIRWRDAQLVVSNSKERGNSKELGDGESAATNGSRLDLGPGWEPHWTDQRVRGVGRVAGTEHSESPAENMNDARKGSGK